LDENWRYWYSNPCAAQSWTQPIVASFISAIPHYSLYAPVSLAPFIFSSHPTLLNICARPLYVSKSDARRPSTGIGAALQAQVSEDKSLQAGLSSDTRTAAGEVAAAMKALRKLNATTP